MSNAPNKAAKFVYPAPNTVRGRILGRFLRGQKLTNKDTWLAMSASRLPADVHVLCSRGWNIHSERIEVTTADAGRKAHPSRYWLDQQDIADAGEEGQRFAESAHQAEIKRRAAC